MIIHIWRVERAHLIETKSYFQISKLFDHTDDIKDILIYVLIYWIFLSMMVMG